MSNPTRARLWALARVALGVSLLAMLLARTDLAAVARQIADVNPWWLLGVLVIPHFGILLSAFKWQRLLCSVGMAVGLGVAVRLYLVGTFFSNFLPSVVGGDLVRAYLLGARHGDHVGVVAATFVERATGLATLTLLVPLALLEPRISGPFGPYIALAVLATAVAGVAGLLVVRRAPPDVRPAARVLLARIRDFASRSLERVGQFRAGPLTLAILLSVVFYLMAMLSVYCAARAVDVSLSPWALLVSVPLVLFVASVPISLNGLGVSELGWVIVLGLFGVGEPSALAIGLLLRARVLITACVGGLVYLMLKRARGVPEAGAPPTAEAR